MRALLLRLEAPLMAFGREAIDQNGPTRDHPDASMLTGLLANALGIRREETQRLQRLQDRLRFAARIDREGEELRDFQTAQLGKSDSGWTTHGTPEGRAGGAGSYAGPHLRFRWYRADAALTVALTLDTPEESPTLDDCRAALDEPVRPLFIGRKPCLPSGPMAMKIVEAPTMLAALASAPPQERPEAPRRFVLPPEEAEGVAGAREIKHLTGRRDWIAGVHAGLEERIIVTLPSGGRS
ncbi:MAG: type I-E CRISPR-associated protein Cas5/CasD [Hyphomicrobiales bacterium]|nr:type I-E CRISPR-associated protein Cas5/CasD [Hyphomicrobiales bacterium]